jgi:hypothetical protein
LKINGDTIENTYTSGISIGNAGNCLISITNNYFISNNGDAIYGGSLSNTLIADNYIINNIGFAGIISIDGIGLDDTIKCNKFMNNAGYSYCICGEVYNGMVINNIFKDNSLVRNLIYLSYYPGGDLFFSNNYFANNSIGSLWNCCYFDDEMTGPSTPILHIDHNTFINNTGASVLFITGPQMSNMSINFLNFKYNSFSDPGAQYELYDDIPYGSPNIYADSNYWGSTSTSHIDSVIYDYFENANLSVVYYSPILEESPAIDTTCPPNIISGIKYQEPVTNFNIFPNPATSNLTVETTQQVTIEIFNIQGQLIKTLPPCGEAGATTGNKTNIDVSAFPSGVYIVQVKSEKDYKVGKFVKE